MLQLYNSMSRRKALFEPIDPEHVRMYVCGPTVYDRAHIGNARPVVVFDVLFRLLKSRFPRVTYARNITDVDDKIIKAAKENGETIDALTTRTADQYFEDMAALGALIPTVEPRATQHVPEMIALIERLIDLGHAYASGGHALFHTSSMEAYGALSGRNRDEQIAGARVEVAPYKKDPADFVLWKPSSDDQPGWDSPWGRGRPGWHIECSAMAEKHLGVPFDIHGGGIDLLFPHHENEVAQTCCAHQTGTMANVWMHNGHLMVNGQKMSKSLGNFFTVADLLADHQGETIRLTLLSTHYRQPLDFTEEALKQAKQTLDRFYGALRSVSHITPAHMETPAPVMDALADDLNTPLAITQVHGIVQALNKAESDEEKAHLKAGLLAAGDMLGILQEDAEAWARWHPPRHARNSHGEDAIEALIQDRQAARRARDFAEADRIRDELLRQGVVLEDGPGGTSWRRAG